MDDLLARAVLPSIREAIGASDGRVAGIEVKAAQATGSPRCR